MQCFHDERVKDCPTCDLAVEHGKALIDNAKLRERISELESHRKQWRRVATEAMHHLHATLTLTSDDDAFDAAWKAANEFLERQGWPRPAETNRKPEGT